MPLKTKGQKRARRQPQQARLKSEELETVDRLIASLPPIITRGEDWFVCENGIWLKRNRTHYEPEALAIIAPSRRTQKMAASVLRHVQAKFQVKNSPLCGAYRFEGTDILISVANGVVRLKSGGAPPELESCSAGYYFTQSLAIPFDPKAVPRTFNKALTENLPDPKDRHLFGIFHASAFVPDCRWETALICFGETGTGKSSLFEGIEAVFGQGPCQSLSLSSLCDCESYNGPDLEFAMFNSSTELNALELAGDRFKQLVSGERVSVRSIYSTPFYIKPTCKYAFLTNHLPRFKDGTGAELRRLRFLKFAHVPSQKDLELKRRIAAEGPGIFNLLVRLVPDLLKLAEMPCGDLESEAARERFKIANDPVGVFVDTECDLNHGSFEDKRNLEARFKTFLEYHGLSEKISLSLFKQLYERFKTSPSRLWAGGVRQQIVNGIELKPVSQSQVI